MQDSLKPRHRSALVEYLVRGMGKKSWKREKKYSKKAEVSFESFIFSSLE